MSTRTVDAVTSTTPMYYVDVDQVTKKLGDVVIERFDGGSVASYAYRPDANNGMNDNARRRSLYTLGVGTGKIDTVNPATVQSVLLDQGWQVRDYLYARSGAALSTVFYYPDQRWDDILDYDATLWPDRKDAGIFPAVLAEFNLQISHMAVRLSSGIFRTVCINGMFTRLFKLGQVAIRHFRDRNLDILPELINEKLVSPSDLPGGQRQMSKMNLAQTIYYLTKSYERMLEASGSSYVRKNDLDVSQLSVFRPSEMKKDTFYGLMDSLKVILDKHGDDVTALDLINAYTSMVNRSEARGTNQWRLFHGADQVINNLVQLGRLNDFFDGTFQSVPDVPDFPEPQPVGGPSEDISDVPLDNDLWNLQQYLREF